MPLREKKEFKFQDKMQNTVTTARKGKVNIAEVSYQLKFMRMFYRPSK